MTIKKTFEYVRRNSYHMRKQVSGADGQAFWQGIKRILASFDDIRYTWLAIDADYAQCCMALNEYDEVDGICQMNEGNHFSIQTARISLTEEPCVRKLIQIALNLGMYEQHVHDCMALHHIDIHTYISDEDLNTLDAMIPVKVHTDIQQYVEQYFADFGIVAVENSTDM